MSNNRRFRVSQKMFEEAVANKLNVSFEDVEIGYTDYSDDMVISIKRGILSEVILLTDDLIYEILNIDKNELEIDYMNYSEDSSYTVGDDMTIEIFTREPSDLKAIA